ncbi:MAG: RND transporter [Nitrospira bacterium SG8_35_4]|nr:MAG: RND transporter [Nitrospira bacterium SG8_35_4]
MKPHNDREPDIPRVPGLDQATGKGRRLKRWIVPCILILLATAALIIWRTDDTAVSARYSTEEVKRGNLTISVTATGRVEPTNQVDVGSELSGIIETVEVDYNDWVKAGQVLARLDTSKLDAQVLKSRAALESAQAKVRQAKATVQETRNEHDRLTKVLAMSGGKVPSRHELDAGEAALHRALAEEAAAEAAVAEARATLDVNETDLSKTVIKSPINGIVLVRAVEPGQTVAASLQAPVLFTIAEDLTKMELHVDVDEADVGQVKEGQDAMFTVDAYPERNFSAQITQVRFGSQKVEGVVTYETLLSVDNSDLSLRPGMTATADITVNNIENTLLIPNAALRFSPPVPKKKPESGGLIDKLIPRRRRRPASGNDADRKGTGQGQRVWVLTEQGQQPIKPVPVKTGFTDGSFTAIADGSLEPGQRVIIGMETIGK